MHDWLKKETKFGRVFLFTEDFPEIPASFSAIPTQATYANLGRFLRTNFEHLLSEPGDNLWFFVADHGCREGDRS